jgi:rubrerythrin
MSETLNNLAKAFVGESQARNRYTFYASTAKKEGYEQIAAIFELTANQEREHANWLLKMINQIKENADPIKVEAEVPTIRGTTEENLKAAIAGENHEYTSMYPEFSKKAIEEGYKEIGIRLLAIAKAEENHEDRYKQLLARLQDKSIFSNPEPIVWVCRECGYIHIGTMPPEECPSCGHAKSFYERKTTL